VLPSAPALDHHGHPHRARRRLDNLGCGRARRRDPRAGFKIQSAALFLVTDVVMMRIFVIASSPAAAKALMLHYRPYWRKL